MEFEMTPIGTAYCKKCGKKFKRVFGLFRNYCPECRIKTRRETGRNASQSKIGMKYLHNEILRT